MTVGSVGKLCGYNMRLSLASPVQFSYPWTILTIEDMVMSIPASMREQLCNSIILTCYCHREGIALFSFSLVSLNLPTASPAIALKLFTPEYPD